MYSSAKREKCTTVREGHLCPFMVKEVGCSFNDQHCRPIIPVCKGEEKICDHIVIIKDKEFCNAYMYPEAVWRNVKKCPLETHLPREEEKKKVILDPRKAAKQRRKG